ncbi:MAG: CoA activase [Deltaproteobacteria bacterium HGW-Deltaproteobacteria-21]|nr:MAG: CoA activase [Deltaproteobacteria bacterium HGW-Deltaproteobacteria-21]
MTDRSGIIGIDVGSIAVAVAEVTLRGEILGTGYEFHHGEIRATLKRILDRLDIRGTCGLAVTSSTPPVLKRTAQYDARIAVIDAARHFYRKVGSILLVGGEKFGLIRFDEESNYAGFKANTSCAAGTGSFLDQQARRLGLKGIEELSDVAFRNRGAIPKIASRCAVFAKTDLIHAQQEGYTLEEICDGLCHGLARNIADTLFAGERPRGPIICAGGVSKNRAVVRHIRSMIDEDLVVHEQSHLFGAIGAALNLLKERRPAAGLNLKSSDDALTGETRKRSYFYTPLELRLSDYPEFTGTERSLYQSEDARSFHDVEVDLYEALWHGSCYRVFLGVDIGSTSTKAVLMDTERLVLAGFYTMTGGRPLLALQSLLAAVNDLVVRRGLEVEIAGAGTTGSGRKFVGRVMGADLVIDEITAHARAACEINPEVDTIIEIGGQDSKFTTLKNGAVTFSVMNTVCAAGTGSFIEEQARKLGCSLSDYSGRVEHRASPMASDRCTVFMERDINHFLSEGYAVDEVLAAVLHSVRENYLTKVAVEGRIGKTISFQGATAKNRALVAAFEQRLDKPIHVSRYCHLTGALGVALILADEPVRKTSFRGIDLFRKEIPLRSEVCDICTNHCKLTLASIEGENVAYGFLCGRDYETKRHVRNNPSGFDLIRERKRAFEFEPSRGRKDEPLDHPVIGLPAALHLYEDLPFWRVFFDGLGFETVTSEEYREAVREGKHAAGAEFCAPIAALHGHVRYLMEKCDYLFLPFYLEKRSEREEGRRQYCYYTQFAPALASSILGEDRSRCLVPLVHYLYSSFHTRAELYRVLRSIAPGRAGFAAVSSAYNRALEFKRTVTGKLREEFKALTQDVEDIYVVLLGRPYTVLSRSMNKGIPDIFGSLGIKTFFQDMLSCGREEVRTIEPLLREMHWHFASGILESAEVAARKPSAYPVLVSSFKCSPDSFLIDYFKRIMESKGKPYLVLQLDEHDSRVGYETRIEAAIRSFRNHHASEKNRRTAKGSPKISIPAIQKRKSLTGKTLLIPNWDNLSLRLIAAALAREGVDARLLEENTASIQKGLRHNTGQCIPLNIIAQDFMDYIEKYHLDPSRTVLWMGASEMACNIHLYPLHIRSILAARGRAMEKTDIHVGPLSMQDLSLRMVPDVYFAYLFGGTLRKIGCRLRPYENVKGETDKAIERSMTVLTQAFGGERSKEEALAEALALFDDIAVTWGKRPKVAVFGDLYARDNGIVNQDLIPFIEANGGEVITTPYSTYLKMIAKPYLRKWFVEGHYLEALTSGLLIAGLKLQEKTYSRIFDRIPGGSEPEFDDPPAKILAAYNVRIENTGESMDNLLKIHHIMKCHPDLALFVQASPAFCCPALVTEAMARRIEKQTGVPIVSVTYDGTGGNKNEVIIPYLKYPRINKNREQKSEYRIPKFETSPKIRIPQ